MELGDLWQELNLGELLLNPQLISAKNPGVNKNDPFVKHEKKWKKPTYNVLKGRYNSLPNEPKYIQKSKITKLADPLRGKFSKFDEIIDDDGNVLGNEKSSPTDISKIIPLNPSTKCSLNSSNNNKGFFLTEAGFESEEEQDNIGIEESDTQHISGVRKRLAAASKYSKYQQSVLKKGLNKKMDNNNRNVKTKKDGNLDKKTQMKKKSNTTNSYNHVRSSGYGSGKMTKSNKKASTGLKGKKSTRENKSSVPTAAWVVSVVFIVVNISLVCLEIYYPMTFLSFLCVSMMSLFLLLLLT